MPSTIPLERTINYAQRFIRNSPLTFVNNGDPAFSSADWVRDTILAPPFAWRWNRGYVSPITCTVGIQDYTVNIPDFGWIEKANLNYPIQQGNPGQSLELAVKLVVAKDQFLNLPSTITAQMDDDNGNITFRIFPPPDQAYILYIVYQKSASNFTSLTQTWSPIPDYMSYLYNQGMKALAYEYAGDERFAFAFQLFMQQLATSNEGLSETEKNLFLDNKIDTLREQVGVQQGKR